MGNADLIKWVRKYSFCFYILEQIVENWCHFSLKCSVEFTSETLWVLYFLFQGRLLITDLISLISRGLFRLSLSPCVNLGSLYLSQNWPISFSYQICGHKVLYNIHLLLFSHSCDQQWWHCLHFLYWLLVSSLFFWVSLAVVLSILFVFFKKQVLVLLIVLYCFPVLHFIELCSNFYYLFVSALGWNCSSFLVSWDRSLVYWFLSFSCFLMYTLNAIKFCWNTAFTIFH